MTVTNSKSTRRSVSYMLGMTSLMLGANYVWISYNSILLLPMVQKVVPERSDLTVGVIAYVSTLVGITASLLAGIISDHSASSLGKRTPYIIISVLFGFPFIALAAVLHLSLPVIAISYLGMQLFTNIGNGAWWPLLVDTIPEEQRGLASGVQGLYSLAAAAAGFIIATYLNEINRADLALLTMAVVFAISGLITVLTIRPYDKPISINGAGMYPITISQAFLGILRVRTRITVFFWLVLSAFIVNIGLNSLQYFARDFIRVYNGLPNPDTGLRLLGLVNLIITMLAAVGTGLLSDKVGRRKLIVLGAFVSAGMTFCMALTRDFTMFLILAGIRSVATGPIVAVIPALASGLSPREEAGQYMAYYNLSTGASTGVASLLFGAILNMSGEASVASFILLLLVSADIYLLGGILFSWKVPQKELDIQLQQAAQASV